MSKFKISIITPCFNSEKYISETIKSVIQQKSVIMEEIILEYIIVDGGSTDNTVSIIESFNHKSIKLISENDRGLYDALVKGLKVATGDVCAYLNAGDYYSNYAFQIVKEMFSKEDVNWLTGLKVLYNENSQIIGTSTPFKYRREFFVQGMYGRLLPFLMQEATFWKRELNNSINYEFLSNLKSAGDYYIWSEFSKRTDLKVVEAYLGGFKYHAGQISENRNEYFKEVKLFTKWGINPFDGLKIIYDNIMWCAPSKIKKIVNKSNFYRYDHKEQTFN